MDQFDKSLMALDRLLEKTSDEELQRILAKVSEFRYEGPTVMEYFHRKAVGICVNIPEGLYSIADETLSVPPPLPKGFIIPNNTAPNYSGLSFFCNIAK